MIYFLPCIIGTLIGLIGFAIVNLAFRNINASSQPFVLDGDQTAFFDVDDTLVIWSYPENMADETIKIGCKNFEQTVLPHQGHISQIKYHKARGHKVVVWSQGGYEWALAVVEALGLEKYVDAVMRKPMWYWDDIDATLFMGKPAYISPYHGFKRRES